MRNQVVLVTPQDEAVGVMEKLEAHQKGLLHRAFSVFIFNAQGHMLLQQRAAQKYHGGLLWTNACCSHPYPGEPIAEAAVRRLEEELGFTVPLQKVFSFTYKAEVENNLIEHEYDHVFVGWYSGPFKANAEEVHQYAYYDMAALKGLLEKHPENFTAWFKIAFPEIERWWLSNFVVKESGSDQ